MADVNGETIDPGGSALSEAGIRVLQNLAELEPTLINAGIFNRRREALAVSSGSPSWSQDAKDLLDALDESAEGESIDSAHIAGAEGEVFVVSEGDLSLVAVTGRFVLASLTSYDMRMALRDLASSESSPEAKNEGNPDA